NSPGVYGDEVDTESTDNVNPDDAYTTCSKGWFSFGDMCYKMGGKKMMARLTWEKAAENCREEHNGNLVTIDSKELQDRIKPCFSDNSSETDSAINHKSNLVDKPTSPVKKKIRFAPLPIAPSTRFPRRERKVNLPFRYQ
ncbi:hypothetical protein NPIL_567981, partial [Nephila pilipes]